MTSTDLLRDCFADLTPTERQSVAKAFLNTRDNQTEDDRIARALADIYTLIAGAAVDAQRREDEILQGIGRVSRLTGERESVSHNP